jgi:hypothetical protein
MRQTVPTTERWRADLQVGICLICWRPPSTVWLLSDQAAFVTGAHLDISGGGFLVRDEPASGRG